MNNRQLQAADEAASPDGAPEKASLVFICKRLRLNYGKLSGEDKAALKGLAGKSDLLKNPIPQRGGSKNNRSAFWEGIMFNEICIYEAKLTKLDEIEELMKEVAEFYLKQDGVIDVHFIKRTHRQKDFNAVKDGELPIRLTKNIGKVTYVLYWVLENEEAHARVSKLGLEKFYKRWNRCLTTMPKIILGENII